MPSLVEPLTRSDLVLSVRAPVDSPIFWVGVKNGVGEKIALILKGLPPSHHLIGKKPQHYK